MMQGPGRLAVLRRVQRRELPSALLDSVFWLNVGIGLAVAILLALLAPVIALAMREPQLTGVLWLLALAFPIVSLGLVQQGLLERASRFRSVALIECCAAFAGLAAGVLAALAGWGVYSLVSQAIVGRAGALMEAKRKFTTCLGVNSAALPILMMRPLPGWAILVTLVTGDH
jgi:O-antigen/teichoic acid export membrane protein